MTADPAPSVRPGPWWPWLLGSGLVAALLALSAPMESLQRSWLDVTLRWLAPATDARSVVVVDIDEPTLQALAARGEPWPFDRALHAAAARTANDWSRRMFNLVVTNVPGPQYPLYAAGARMVEAFPVVPLTRGQALSIGVTSYDGQVFFGLFGDREAMSDLEVLGEAVTDALEELVDTTHDPGRTRPKRRRPS